jgi:hypothetical protein
MATRGSDLASLFAAALQPVHPYERTRCYGTRTCFILAINAGSILNSP